MSNKHFERPEKQEVVKTVEVPRKRKTKLYLLTLLVGAGLIVGSLYYKNDNGSSATVENDNKVAEVKNEEKKNNTVMNYLEGTLSNSDNQVLGNLKLSSKDGEVYLRTSRDFSKLLGMQVMVLINGTLEKFEMVDIQSKVAADGYILPQ